MLENRRQTQSTYTFRLWTSEKLIVSEMGKRGTDPNRLNFDCCCVLYDFLLIHIEIRK